MHRIPVYPGGFELTLNVPQTIEEYNALAPTRNNPVLEDAIANTAYRSVFAEFRSKFSAAIGKATGITRKTKRVGDGEDAKEVFDETEGKHLARVQAELGLEDDDFTARFQSLAQEIIDGCKFDPSIRTREGGDGPKVGKNDLKMAKELLALGGDKVADVAGKLGAKLGRTITLGDDAAANEKTLARAFGDWRRKQAEETAARTKAELGLA